MIKFSGRAPMLIMARRSTSERTRAPPPHRCVSVRVPGLNSVAHLRCPEGTPVRKRNLVIAGLAGLTLAGGSLAVGATAFAATPAPTTLKACVSPDGTMKAASASATKCSQGRTLLTWNVKGKDGANGKDGVAGAKGEQGVAGDKGADGAQGADGARGAQGSPGMMGPPGMGMMGPQGPAGAKGDKGDNGAPGTAGSVVTVTKGTEVSIVGLTDVSLTCGTGTAIGASFDTGKSVYLFGSAVDPADATTWNLTFDAPSASGSAQAICLSIS
jgi:hypothetical protein